MWKKSDLEPSNPQPAPAPQAQPSPAPRSPAPPIKDHGYRSHDFDHGDLTVK
jgi:hypothetical protein